MERHLKSITRRGLVRAGIAGGAGAATGLVAASPASATNGIQALIAVTQTKTNQANDEALEALDGARRQRQIIAQAKLSRKFVSEADAHVSQVAGLNKTIGELQAKLKELAVAADGCP